MNRTSLITILMATYNGEKFIKEQLDSLLAQTYVHWQLIIRDDGSKDNTVSIIHNYMKKDNRITLMINETNIKGACANFSSLLSYANKNLVLVNADFPRYKKNQLSKQQVKENEALAEKYNSSGKFPFTVLLNANGKILKQWDGLPDETPEKFVDEIKTFDNAAN